MHPSCLVGAVPGIAPSRFLKALCLAGLVCLGLVSEARSGAFDGYDLGEIDPGDLVDLQSDPIALDALVHFRVELPLAAAEADAVAVLLIDPDGNPLTDDSFALPIRLGDLVEPGEDGLFALIGAAEEILAVEDLGLIEGLTDLLDSLLGGLLGGILGAPDPVTHLSLDDLADELDGGVITAIGIDLGDLTGYVLDTVFGTVSGLLTCKVDVVDEVILVVTTPNCQPDLTVGLTGNRANHLGDDFYSEGSGQTLRRTITSPRSLRTFFTLQNDGSVHDTLVTSSTNFRSRTHIRKSILGGFNITAAVVTGLHELNLATQSTETLVIHDSQRGGRFARRPSPTSSYTLTLRSATDPSKTDTAISNVRTLKKRPVKPVR